MTRVVYFGNERLISGLSKTDAPILSGLIERGYEVVAVISHHSSSNSRNQRSLEVAEIANTYDIPVFLPSRPSDIIDELKSLKPDIAVLAAYGRIISQQVIDLFPLGIINLHPSLLPKYRGPTPIESVILNGDAETGVSIMQLSAGMDEGPVYAQSTLAVDPAEEKFTLYSHVVDVSTKLFFDSFPKIIDGSLVPQEQDSSRATYSRLIDKSDGTIDWHKPALQIEREIRAYAGWPQSRATIGSIDAIILEANLVPNHHAAPGKVKIADNHSLIIGTTDGGLAITLLKPLGKKEMPVQAFLAGYRSKITD
jgi:methionyl-tRNA formyltransferase